MTNTRSLSLILSEIGSAMDDLLELGKKKTEVLVVGDIGGLEKLLPSEQELVQKLQTLEGERHFTVGNPFTIINDFNRLKTRLFNLDRDLC